MRRYRVRADRIDIVPGGVQAEIFSTGLSRAEARALGWPKDRVILLTVRRLARRMGLENFIEAVSQLRSKEPAILAILAMPGPLAAELASLRRRAWGPRQAGGFCSRRGPAVAYRGADLSVVPSITLEGFGLIVLSRWQLGRP
jgi:glycosyltransferase involved in cell wall biosynthesis